MSKSKHKTDTFRKIKKVPSDTKKYNVAVNDTEYDIIFNCIPRNIQIPAFYRG